MYTEEWLNTQNIYFVKDILNVFEFLLQLYRSISYLTASAMHHKPFFHSPSINYIYIGIYFVAWGYSTKFNMARLRPKVQLFTLLYNIFHRKGTPFVYLLLKNGTPFTYLVENFASLLTDINALSFNYESITNSEHFFDFFTAIKCIVSPFGLLREQKDRFLYLSYPSTCEIPFLIHTWSLEKVPLSIDH